MSKPKVVACFAARQIVVCATLKANAVSSECWRRLAVFLLFSKMHRTVCLRQLLCAYITIPKL